MPNYAVRVPDTVQGVVFATCHSRIVETCWCFQRIAGHYNTAVSTVLALNIYNYLHTYLMPFLSADYAVNSIFVLGLDPFPDVITGKFGPTYTGGKPEGSEPNNVGFRLELETVLAGQAYRGWNTLVGIPKSEVVGDKVSLGWANSVQYVWNGIGPLVNGLGWNWVVASTMFANAPRATGIATQITNVRYKDLIVDSCRHRLLGRRF